MEYNNIKLERENSIATLRLNRPDAMNALNPDLLEEFSHALAALKVDESVKALVVRGEGRCFSAGADLVYFQTAFSRPDLLTPYLQKFNDCLFQLEALPVPVIAVVHGFALAGGLELMLACDMALAVDDARLGDQHVNFGLMPGGGSTQRLPRRIGMQRAMDLITSGRWLSGVEAAEWGLVLRSAAAGELEQELEKILAPLRTKSRPGLGWIKSVALRGRDLPLEDGVALEIMAFAQYVATSPHPTEGLNAFREKRQPEF